jgi:(4S)-4-hydroxy-5-phosphonooxypentane-2,3-dione isomerase
MLIRSVFYTFAPEDADKAEALFRELRDASRREDGVVDFEVGRGQTNRNAFALWEAYRDEAALDAHAASEHFKRLVVDGVRRLSYERDGDTFEPL